MIGFGDLILKIPLILAISNFFSSLSFMLRWVEYKKVL